MHFMIHAHTASKVLYCVLRLNQFTPMISIGGVYPDVLSDPERIPQSGMSRILQPPLGIRRNCSGFDPEFTEGSKGNRRIGAVRYSLRSVTSHISSASGEQAAYLFQVVSDRTMTHLPWTSSFRVSIVAVPSSLSATLVSAVSS